MSTVLPSNARDVPVVVTGAFAGARPTAAERASWARRWIAALGQEYQRRGIDPDRARFAAIANVAHLAREAGWGRAEYNHAPGNAKCQGAVDPPGQGWEGACHRLPDGQWYRAFADDGAFARDYVDLTVDRYREAWAILSREPTTIETAVRWYGALMRGGYHPWSQGAEDEYRRIVASVAAMAGEAVPPGERAPGEQGDTDDTTGPVVVAVAAVGGVLAALAWRRWKRARPRKRERR